MVIGIDADTRRLAIAAIGNGRVVRVGTIERGNQRGAVHPEYDAQLTRTMRWAQEVGAIVYLEDTYLPATGNDARNVRVLKSLNRVAGEIERAARMHSVPLRLVSASAWRAGVLGTYGAREKHKAAAMARAMQYVNRDLTEHEADAICIAQYGAMEEEHEIVQTRLECDQ